MSKMLVKSFLWSLVVGLGLTFSSVVSAANFNASADITVSGVTGNNITADMIVFSGAEASEWSHSGGALTVTGAVESSFRVGSSNPSVACLLVKNSSSETVRSAANSTPGTSSVTVQSGSGTYTVQPSTSACTSSQSSSGGGGGGGGGGTPPVVVTPPIVPVVPTPPSLPAVVSGLTKFTVALTAGVNNSRVRDLQKFLNQSGFSVALSGAGSPGKETTTFGPATKAALIKFQLAKGIIKSATGAGAGRLGPATMAVINATLAVTAQPAASSVANSPGLNADQFQKLLQILRGVR